MLNLHSAFAIIEIGAEMILREAVKRGNIPCLHCSPHIISKPRYYSADKE